MAKDWGGKTYDEDFYEINAWGERQSDQRDQAANDAYYAANPQQASAGQGQSSPWQSQSKTTTTPAPRNPAYEPLEKSVMGKLLTDIPATGVVNQQDPAYQQGIQANQLQTSQAADRARAAAVQRRAATGTGTSGAVDTDVNKVLEQQAGQDKTFEANLLDKFRTQELDKSARALTLGSGMLTAEQERQLRESLTLQGYDLQREGYDVQRDLAGQDLAYRRDALGQQLALSQADLDQRAMIALLNG